jgi:hypothetical protein
MDRQEREHGDRRQRRAPYRPTGEPDHGDPDDANDGGGEALEDRADPSDVAVRHVRPGEAEDQEERRQDERDAGDQPAERAVEQPPDIDRELLRLRPGQERAVAEGVQEPALADPAPPIHQLVVHQGDLSGRPAEVHEPELHPEARGLAEAHPVEGGLALGA